MSASNVVRISAELREELAASDAPRLVDPRGVPVRVTHLAEIRKSPAHYLYSVQHGKEETLPLRMGIATHALVFGTPQVLVYRGGEHADAKGKVKVYSDVRNGACWEAFKAKHAGDVIVNDTELRAAEALARALTEDMDVASLLFGAGVEHEKELTATVDGRKRKGRVDALTPAALSDLKVVKSSEPRWFRYQARDLCWHAKLAWYVDLADLAGYPAREPVLVAVEKTPPHVVQVFRLTDRDYALGQRTYREWWDRLMACEAAEGLSGFAPGYAPGPLPLALDTITWSKESDDDDD